MNDRGCSQVVIAVVVAACATASLAEANAAEFRYWTTAAGRRSAVQLEFLEQVAGRIKLKRQDNGRVIELPLRSLSEQDRAYVREMAAASRHESVIQGGHNWPQFRGPGGTGRSLEVGVPETWNATENILWRTALRGRGSSSPIIYGDHVYVTCYSGYGLSATAPGDPAELHRHLLCLNRGDGSIQWQHAIPATVVESPYEGGVAHHGYATSTPAADEDGVYVYFGASGAAAFSHAGQRRWQTSCGTTVYNYGSAASPIVSGDYVIINAGVEAIEGEVAFGSHGALIVLNKATGREVWRQTDRFAMYPTPALLARNGELQILAGMRGGGLASYALQDGQPQWNCSVPIYAPTPVVEGETIYVLAKEGYAAVRADGDPIWQVSKSAYRLASPVYWQGYLYFARKNPALACCADARTGALLYQERLPDAGEIYASPVMADGRIYFISQRQGTYVLKAEPEFELLARNIIATDESIFNGSPAISGGKLFLRSDQFVYCIGSDRRENRR